MEFISLFDKYFLILMLFQAVVYIFIDCKHFYFAGMMDMSKKSRSIGIIVGIISVSLYLLNVFLLKKLY